MMRSSLLPAFLLLSCALGNGQAVGNAKPQTDIRSDEALVQIGGGNASGYQILKELDGWDAAGYADAMLVSIRAKWYPRIQSLPQPPPIGQRETIIDIRVSGNGSISHMTRRASTKNRAQDKAAREALAAAGPFQPFPAELHAKTLKLRFHFIYNLPASGDRPLCVPLRPGTYKVNSEVTAPQVQNSPDPEFSEAARQVKFQGEVELNLTVAEDGQVRDVCVAKSLGEGLDEKSVNAVKNWKFAPGIRQGKPVPVRMGVTTNFHIY